MLYKETILSLVPCVQRFITRGGMNAEFRQIFFDLYELPRSLVLPLTDGKVDCEPTAIP